MGKIKNCFESFGLLSGIKMILIEIQCRLWSGTSNKVVGIHSKRTGKNKIYFRKNTSDYDLIKTILMNVGEYDFLILDQVDFLSQVKVIVDAGANIGLFSRICRKLNSSAKIIAIEPEESNFDLLTKNLEPRGGNILLKNGLWNHSANLVIEEESVDKWAFTVKETDVASERSIKAVSIPEIMNTYNIDFIDIFKCDIEGSEWNVFDESCEEWINKIGVLIVETHDRFKAGCEDRVLSVMQKHNFSGKKISEDWVFINKQFYEQVEDKYVRL